MQGLSEVTKRKISLGNMEIKIMAFVMIAIKTILTKMMKTNIIQEKRASLIRGKFLLLELIDTNKTILMKLYNIQLQKFQGLTQMRQRRSILIN